MSTNMRTKIKIIVALLVVAALFGSGLYQGQAFARPASLLPLTTCTSTGVNAVTCDLWAKTGTLDLPGQSGLPIWGFSATVDGAASLPGPALIVTQNDTVTVNLTNGLNEPVALFFLGQALVPANAGVPGNGGTGSFTFTATKPGTYLYEAGLLANSQHQVAMGLYGALIVRPATATQAYDAATAFDDEVLLVLSELDTNLNTSADPAGFDMRDYKPQYGLVNGQAYTSQVLPFPIAAGNKVLLRYVNAGLQLHSMGVLGLHQNIIAEDGSLWSFPRQVVAETISAGQTLDALVNIPVDATTGSQFAIYDANMLLHNNNGAGFGGMLTFLAVSGSATGVTPPVTSSAILTPASGNGTAPITLSANGSSAGDTVTAMELYIDNTSDPLQRRDLTGTFNSANVTGQYTFSPAELAGLSSGIHKIYVHSQDSTQWGPYVTAILNLDKTGPATYALTLAPNPSNGTLAVALAGTADDSAVGNSAIAAAEYFIGAPGADGSGTAMTVGAAAPVAGLQATIPATALTALADGSYDVNVHAQDAFGNWGAFTKITLTVDKAGPTTSAVAASANPNNGALWYNINTNALHVTASFGDNDKVVAAEGFIDVIGQNGKGFGFIATDGSFNSANETGYANVPLSTINLLAQGNHTIYVHGKDASGNWGAFGPNSSTVLVIDKTKPVLSVLPSAAPNPTNTTVAPFSNNLSFTLSATASDAATGNTNITAAEWYEGADPGAGKGTAMFPFDAAFNSPTEVITATINFVTLGWAPGSHTLYVRGKDSVGYWSTPAPVVVNVVYPTLFGNGFESGNFSGWSATGGTLARISVTSGSAQSGTYKLQAQVSSGASGYVQDNTPAAETSYRARFYFNPNGLNTGSGNNPTAIDIFTGLNSSNATMFQVQYRRSSSTGYQVRLGVARSGGTTFTNWYAINNNAWNYIEVGWQKGSAASATFYTNGTLRQTLTNLNTNANLIEAVRLGPQGSFGSISGAVYFDNFVSNRYQFVIGP
jgi:FtsP/CotA-like multicopper oxidase with cupredoxin domain